MTRLGRKLAILAIITPMMIVSPSASDAASSGYFVQNSSVWVPQQSPIPSDAATSISISAAANEYEAVQLVVHGGDSGVRGVDLSLVGPLSGDYRASIPVEAVVFYRAHYVTIPTPSDGAGSSRVMLYSDALIPFRNPHTGERLGTPAFPGAPFDVQPGGNQPVYVEFFIPPGTWPGTYRGTIQILHDQGLVFAEVPVAVTVHDFTLPVTTSLRTNFQGFDSNHFVGPARYFGYAEDSPQHLAVARAVDEMLISHRLMPEAPQQFSFTTADLASDGSLDPSPEKASAVLSLLNRPDYTDYVLGFRKNYPFSQGTTTNRQRTINYLRSAYQWFEENGVADKLSVRPGDEPYLTSDFTTIRDLAQLAREANPNYTVSMTVNFDHPGTAQFLYGAINRLGPIYGSFDPVQALARQAAGDEIWTYTALVQFRDTPSPFWQIDFPLLNYRIVPWINFRHGVTGMLYWTTAYWAEHVERGTSPWTVACGFREDGICYNGEGMLVYPGREISFVVPASAHGAETDVFGAVPSLRLKALRDGIEDHEYLAMASEADPLATGTLLIDGACDGSAETNCFHQWTTEETTLLDVREQLAAIINAEQSRARLRAKDSSGRPMRPRTQERSR